MFDNPKIKAIRRMPEGNNIILIWVMLLTIAGRCNADGNIFLTEKIRYNAETLADELRFPESVVRLALNVLTEYSMIICQEDAFYIKNWEEYQNVEGMAKVREQTRLRVAKHREKAKALPESNVTRNATVTQSNATDKESDSYSKSDSKSNSSSDSFNSNNKEVGRLSEERRQDTEEYSPNFEIFWNEYPRKIGKKEAYRAFRKVREPLSVLLDAVRLQKESEMWAKENGRFIPNPATWLNQGRWEDQVTRKAGNRFMQIAEALYDDNGNLKTPLLDIVNLQT